MILPGASVASGGYLRGYITTTGSYCGTLAPSLVANLEKEVALPVVFAEQPHFIRIYPNPTTDIVVVELTGSESDGTTAANITVYTMQGGKLLQKSFDGESKFQFSLAGKPVGIYLVHVQEGERMEVARVVKTN